MQIQTEHTHTQFARVGCNKVSDDIYIAQATSS